MTTLKKALVLCSLACMAGCASLTKTQVESVNTYSTLLEKYADYPGSIIKEFIQLKYDVELLNTGTFSDTVVNTRLWTSYNGKKKALEEAAKIDLGIQLIAEYASALAKLSSKDLSDKVVSSTKKMGTDMDSLISVINSKSDLKIPSGIGELVKSSYSSIGSIYVKHRQAKDLKRFVGEGEKIIPLITEVIKTDLIKMVINNWLPPLKNDLKNRQENFLRNIPVSEYKVFLANYYNRDVAVLIARIDNLEQLATKTIKSVDNITKAHKQLYENIQERKKIVEFLSETHNLYLSVKDIYTNYQNLMRN